VNCHERDQLDAEVAQATLEWTALHQTPLPDVSIPGGLKEADDLTRRRANAREILSRAGQHTSGIAERMAARIDICFSVARASLSTL
jgi:hypothetical protein